MKTVSVKQLASIEDGIHKQLKRLAAATESDPSLAAVHDGLRDAWSRVYGEVRMRQEAEAAADGGSEVLCTVFAPRPDGGITETRICRRVTLRRYSQAPAAHVFTDVHRELVTAQDLALHLRMAR